MIEMPLNSPEVNWAEQIIQMSDGNTLCGGGALTSCLDAAKSMGFTHYALDKNRIIRLGTEK